MRPFSGLLFIGVCLWLAACNVRPDSTPTGFPTEYPPVTLTVYKTPESTRQSPTSTHLNAALSQAYLPNLTFPTLNCYELPSDHTICLGTIHNPSERPVENILVELTVREQQHITGPEQQMIPNQHEAPYRIFFNEKGIRASEVAINLLEATHADDSRLAIDVTDERIEQMLDGQYKISATFTNISAKHARVVRGVVSLYNLQEEMVGYRVLTLSDGLSAGGQQSVEFEILPQQMDENLWHVLYVEAYE